MYINRLQALNIAISAINQLPDSEQNKQAIERLENMKKDKYIRWTKEMVFEQLDKWKSVHNRNPTVTDLVESDMPKVITIKKLFDMRASAFLNIYYPRTANKHSTSKYSIKTKQEWVDNFIEEFNRIQPQSSKDYNAKRDPDSPTWLTIARYLGLSTWGSLLEYTHLKIPKQDTTRHYTVTSTSSLYNKLEALLNEKIINNDTQIRKK